MSTAVRVPRSRRVTTTLQLAAGMVFGAMAGFGGVLLVEASPPELRPGAAGTILLSLFFVVAWPLMVGVHELGHLAGGISVGFRPILFLVGPLRVERAGGRFRVRIGLKGALFGGLAVSAPTDTRDLRRRTLWIMVGGPLASLVAGVLFLGVRPFLKGAPVLDMLLLILGIVSLLIGLISSVPAQGSGFYSDGGRILRLVRGGADVEREVAALAVMALSMSGQRPREWIPELVAQAAAGEPDTLFGVVGRQYAYMYALDRGQPDAARAHLEAAVGALQLIPANVRSDLLLHAAYFAARVDRDPGRARELLASADGDLFIPDYARPLAEAALSWAEGNHDLAAERLDAAEAGLEGGLDAGATAAAAAEIASFRAELRTAASLPPALSAASMQARTAADHW